MEKKGVAPLVRLYREVYRKNNPRSMAALTDEEVLGHLIGKAAARSIMQEIGTAENFFDLDGQKLLNYPAIGEGTAMLLELIGEWILRALGEREEITTDAPPPTLEDAAVSVARVE